MKTKFWLIQVNTKSDRGYKKISNLAHNFEEGEAKSGGNIVKMDPKVQFFLKILLPVHIKISPHILIA